MIMMALMPRIRKMVCSSAVIVCPRDCCTLPLESNILRTTAAMAKPKASTIPMTAMPQYTLLMVLLLKKMLMR